MRFPTLLLQVEGKFLKRGVLSIHTKYKLILFRTETDSTTTKKETRRPRQQPSSFPTERHQGDW